MTCNFTGLTALNALKLTSLFNSSIQAMTLPNPNTLREHLKKPSLRLLPYGFYVFGVFMALSAAAVLVSAQP